MKPRVIRKYGNRRLYDTVQKQYVNLDEIAQVIRDGSDVQVVDAKSGQDLTRDVLTQIIVEETRARNGGLPLEIVRDLVAFSGAARHDALVWTLRTALDTYRKVQHAPVEFVRGLFTKPEAGHRDQPEQPATAPETDNTAQLRELRERVQELERQLKPRASRKPRPKGTSTRG